MKLKKLLKNLDSWTDVRIFRNDGEFWKPVYEGPVLEVPWHLTKCHLIKAKNNEGSEAICAFKDGEEKIKIRITLGD